MYGIFKLTTGENRVMQADFVTPDYTRLWGFMKEGCGPKWLETLVLSHFILRYTIKRVCLH